MADRNFSGVRSLTARWGLRRQRILRAIPAVALLLVGPPMSDRLKVMIQTKRDRYPGPPRWGLGVTLTSSRKKVEVGKKCQRCLGEDR